MLIESLVVREPEGRERQIVANTKRYLVLAWNSRVSENKFKHYYRIPFL